VNPIQKIKLLAKLNKDANEIEEGVKIKNATKIAAGIVAAVTAIAEVPQVQHFVGPYLTAHPGIYAMIGAIGAIAALFHNPQADQ